MANAMLIIWFVGMLLSVVAMYLMLRIWYTPSNRQVDTSTRDVK